jgi:hypothetical protein
VTPAGPADAYYWAAGERVPLRGGDEVAVDLDAAAAAGVDSAQVDGIRRAGRPLTGALVLVDGGALDEGLRGRLDQGGALQPVYHSSDGTLIVVLPEVRVEAAATGATAKVKQAVHASGVDADVTDTGSGRVTVVPKSGRGADALTLANEISERAHPEVAQARFLRVVPRPDTRA